MNIRLRALSIEDIEKTYKWHNDGEIKLLYSSHPFSVSLDDEKNWYRKILSANIPVSVFGIEIIETRELIGIASLKDINMINRCGEFGMYVGDKALRGKGVSEAVTPLILDYAFNKLGLNRVYSKFIEGNIPSEKLCKRFGFRKEGLLRESLFRNGKYMNEIVYSILRSEYEGKNSEFI